MCRSTNPGSTCASIASPARRKPRRCRTRLRSALADVRHACTDWPAMRQAARGSLRATARESAAISVRGGARKRRAARVHGGQPLHLPRLPPQPRCSADAGGARLVPIAGSELGIVRNMPPPLLAPLQAAHELLVVTKSNHRSTVHRPGYLDVVAVKEFDARGRLCGEAQFRGLWTSNTYHADPRTVPLLRLKVARVIGSFPFRPSSHDGKRLVSILENLPRDELFQASAADLRSCARSVLALHERARGVCLVMRRDKLRHFWSCLVFLGRERLDNGGFRRIEAVLKRALGGGQLDSSLAVGDGALAQLHVTVRVAGDAEVQVRRRALERELDAALVTWRERVHEALRERTTRRLPRRSTAAMARRFRPPTSRMWRPRRPCRTSPISTARPPRARDTCGCACRRAREHPRAPAAAAPWRTAADFRSAADPGEFRPAHHRRASVRTAPPRRGLGLDPGFRTRGAGTPRGRRRRARGAAQHRLHGGPGRRTRQRRLPPPDRQRRTDRGADARAARLLPLPAADRPAVQPGVHGARAARACAHRRATCGGCSNGDSIRPRPSAARSATRSAIEHRSRHAIGEVRNPDDDRILRSFLAVILATLRTNYFRSTETRRPLAFKLQPRAIPGLPEPRPDFEIFVHGTHVEGVHMRRGLIARGGIRWSERPEDFRTEVLGLMKAQHVKNTLIVPVGAKGGFVARRLRAGAPPDERARVVLACYQAYIRCLLEVTDNIVDGKVQPPELRAAARRRRSVSRGRGRQGHRELFRRRQRDLGRVRLLARRRLRLRRLGRVRPQEDGHHGARRLGVRQAAFPRAGRRHHARAVHGRRHRRHVGRCVRQRHAALAAHPPAGGLRSPPHLHRSGSGRAPGLP